MGTDIGANVAALYAASEPKIRATVLISPGRDYRGIVLGPELVRSDKRPMLLIASEGDTYSASICSALHKAAPGYSELRSYAGTAHGENLLDEHPDAVEQILAWLEPIIGDGPLASAQGGIPPVAARDRRADTGFSKVLAIPAVPSGREDRLIRHRKSTRIGREPSAAPSRERRLE